MPLSNPVFRSIDLPAIISAKSPADSLPEDFQDVQLDLSEHSIPVRLPGGIISRAAIPLDYSNSSSSSSSSSSRSSSARSSTNSANSSSEDFEYLSDDNTTSPTCAPSSKEFYPSQDPLAPFAKLSSRRSSTNTVLSTSTVGSSDDDDSDEHHKSNSTSLPPSEYSLTANKLNGYLLHSLKSKSSLSLLNPNQASVQSRQSAQSAKESLFNNSSLASRQLSSSSSSPSLSAIAAATAATPSAASSTPRLNAAFEPKLRQTRNASLPLDLGASSYSSSQYSPTFSSKRLGRSYIKAPPSASLLAQASQASQGLRVSRSTVSSTIQGPTSPNSRAVSSVVLPESANETETDAFAPLPSSKRNLQRALSRSGNKSHPNLQSSAAATPSSFSPKHSNSNSNSLYNQLAKNNKNFYDHQNNASQSQTLSAQQRLRLRRSKSSNRLTTKQLEMQFDSEDADDEIPSDSLVWNVPLSPALYAKTQQMKQPPPARNNALASSCPASAAAAEKITNKRNRKRAGSINHVQHNTIKPLTSIKEASPTLYFSNAGLENLSEDARDLTMAFQELPSAKTFDEDMQRVSEQASVLKLPPKNRDSSFSNGGIPVSKEKEAVLSRTRPAWLPPKSAEEEKRHIYEYQKMMAYVSELEKTAEQRKKQQEEEHKLQRRKDEETWKTRVLPNFEKAIEEPRTRELWWRGIPPKYRSIVWKARAGNNLGVTRETYNKALTRAKALTKAYETGEPLDETFGLSKEQEAQLLAQFMQMDEDIEATYPDLKMFDAKLGPMHESLVNVLQAFALFRPAIGYQKGLSYVAATLLLNLDTIDAFVAMCNLLNHSLCQALYLHDERELTSYYQSFLKVLNNKMPSLYTHFKTIRIAPAAYLEPILRSLFALHLPSIDCVSRVWDVMFFEGDGFLLRAALGVLAKLEHKLYSANSEEVVKIIGWNASIPITESLGDEDTFMSTIRNILKN